MEAINQLPAQRRHFTTDLKGNESFGISGEFLLQHFSLSFLLSLLAYFTYFSSFPLSLVSPLYSTYLSLLAFLLYFSSLSLISPPSISRPHFAQSSISRSFLPRPDRKLDGGGVYSIDALSLDVAKRSLVRSIFFPRKCCQN